MRKIFTLILVGFLMSSCDKQEAEKEEPTGTVSIAFSHFAGADSLIMDEVYYTNAAGNQYRVSFLKYFVSGLTLYNKGSKLWQTKAPPISINAKYKEYQNADFEQVPIGSYDSLSIAFGIVPAYNYHGSFEMSYNDYNMYWPTNLGGGYHFMKFEGHWRDGNDHGMFAFHIGANENLITLGFDLPVKVNDATPTHIIMTMNTNEWFENPYLYDLTQEDGYTMGNQGQMHNLVLNGQHAFTAKLKATE